MYDVQFIANRIKQEAKSQNHKLNAMLKELDLGINAISQLSNGQEMSYLTFASIADYLNCSVDYLLGRTDTPNVAGSTYINDNHDNINQVINGDFNVNANTSEQDDKQLFDMIKSLDLLERAETIVYINNLKNKK